MATRRYDMSARGRAREQTREAILDAAVARFGDAWYDEVTLADVAAEAGVSQQTVVNHFGNKIGLYTAALAERAAPAIVAERDRAIPGQVDSVIETVTRDYERTGIGTWRLVVLADRIPELMSVVAGGRRAHREWIERVFAPQLRAAEDADREQVVTLLATVLNVTTWYTLRHEADLEPGAAAEHLRALVTAVLTRR
ncbi:TetR/AcrR family transcriptional regulator [Nocardia farcinica]|uniref:TetR/AcrR family transcriptional regulator n=1 Tax=Nocardia farcinica TaxID=37329 RepID=UPI002453895E|nr:TetR/AcrR family transcriptional regulator [Nocardia farcinica]